MNAQTLRLESLDRPSVDEGIDLFAYLVALLKAKFWILGAAILLGLIALGYSYTLPELYESNVRVDLVNLEDPGGVSPDNRRASEVLTLVEHGFVLGTTKDNYLDVMLAKMRSRQFSLMFIEKHDLYKAFYPDQWLESEQSWLPGFEPDRGQAFKILNEQVRFIDHNPETDIISVRMRWEDPQLVRDWANAYVAEFNDFMRQQAMADVAEKKVFLEQELARTTIADIRQSIYRLIEAQTAVAMLASSRDDYILEVIDPALMPFDRHSPSKKTFLILGLFFGGMLAIAIVLASVMFQNLRRAFNNYQRHPTTIGLRAS